jgi:Dynamin family
MDLKTYEQVKFELAALIRSGQLIASEPEKDPNKRHDLEQSWRNLLNRLAEDRFTVVVAGRFSRGKSSLMNAVLGMDRLPTGIVPLTSVITYVRYGTSERVLLNYEGTRLRGGRLEIAIVTNLNPAPMSESRFPDPLARHFGLGDT